MLKVVLAVETPQKTGQKTDGYYIDKKERRLHYGWKQYRKATKLRACV